MILIFFPVNLTPDGTLDVCPQQSMLFTFTCTTTDTGALLWIQGIEQHFYTTTSMVGDTGIVGDFTTRLDSIEGLNLTSTATTNVSSLLHSNISNIMIMCDDNGDTIGAESTVLTISGTSIAWGLRKKITFFCRSTSCS